MRKSPSPPPGGHPRVASLALRAIHLRVAPKGSGEECGRKPESQHNKTGLLQSYHEVGTLVEVFAFPKLFHCRPHSSSVRKTVLWDRFSDSFSPGEAIGCCRTRGFFDSLKRAFHLERAFLRLRWTAVFVYTYQFRGFYIVANVQMSAVCIQKCEMYKIGVEIFRGFVYNDRVVVLTRPPKDIHGRYAFPKGVFNHVYR